VGTAIGELEVFQEEAQFHQAPPVEEICQFFQAVKWKGETLNSCCRSGELFAPLQDYPEEFKELFEDSLFLVKVSSCKQHLSTYVHGCIVYGKNPDFDAQLAKAREDMYKLRVQGTTHHRVVTVSPIEPRTPSSAQLHFLIVI